MKNLARQHWGAEEEVLLRIYGSLIIDHGFLIYMPTGKSKLRTLNPVHKIALRICLEASWFSPAEILYPETHELPLWLRWQLLLLNYDAKSIHKIRYMRKSRLLAQQVTKPLEYNHLNCVHLFCRPRRNNI